MAVYYKDINIKKVKRSTFILKLSRALITAGYLVLLVALFKDDAKATVAAMPLLVSGGLMLPVGRRLAKRQINSISLAVSISSLVMAWVLGTEFARVLPYDQPIWVEALVLALSIYAFLLSFCGVIGLLIRATNRD